MNKSCTSSITLVHSNADIGMYNTGITDMYIFNINTSMCDNCDTYQSCTQPPYCQAS